MRHRWKYYLLSTIGFISILAIFLVFKCSKSDYKAVMYVDGEPVTIQEFKQRMEYDYRAVTIDYFTKNHHAVIGENFWNQQFDGVTPYQFLIDKTIEGCTYIKIQELEMQKRGVLEDISYQSFLKDFERENQRRKEIVENGGVIYGPQQYSENEYFEYVFANLKIELKDRMAKDLGWNDEKNLRQYYEEHKDTYYKKTDDIEILKISVPYNKSTKENLYTQLMNVVNNSSDRESFEKSASLVGEVVSQTFTEDTARTDSRYNELLKLTAMDMNPGSVSNVIDDGEKLAVIYCLSKKDGGYVAFESVSENVNKMYVDECYGNWLEERYNKANVFLEDIEKIIKLD